MHGFFLIVREQKERLMYSDKSREKREINTQRALVERVGNPTLGYGIGKPTGILSISIPQ